MPDAVLVSDETAAEMQEILLASTAAGREAAGTCSVRAATSEEREQSGLAAVEPWVLSEFRTTRLGAATHVERAPAGLRELSWHTHPGLRFSMAGFSDGDVAAVQQTRQPLLVIGYTVAAPETLSWLAIAGGWQGVVVTAVIQGALRLEAAGKLPTGLSRVGVAARLLLPDGGQHPVRRLRAAGWQRALETGTFEVDKAVAGAANVANRWAAAAWRRVRR